jgi:hypothetical protein
MITLSRTKHRMKMLFDRDYPEKYKEYLERVGEFNAEFLPVCINRWMVSIPLTLIAANVPAVMLGKPIVLLYFILFSVLVGAVISTVLYLKKRHELYTIYTK